MFEFIPDELKKQNSWVNASKYSKVPMQSNEELPASVGDSDTWCDFTTAAKSVENGTYDYIGYVFHDNGYIGIDIDKGFEMGFLSELSTDLMNLCKSYTEVSKSGRGIHIIIKGDLPFNGKNNFNGVEIYKTGRYFITTGKKLIYDQIVEDTDGSIIQTILDKYFPVSDTVTNYSKEKIYSPVFEKPSDYHKVNLVPVYPEIGSGARNLCLTSLAGSMYRWGYNPKQIYTEIIKVNKVACSTPLPVREIENLIISVSKYRR